jgi:hypothetical protein
MTVWKDRHLSDKKLLLAIDGELAPRRASRARKHLENCAACRERSARFKRTLSAVIDAHLEQMDSQVPPDVISSARLSSRLWRMEESSGQFPWRLGMGGISAWLNLTGAGALLILLVLALRLFPIPSLPSPSMAISFLRGAPDIQPKPDLTPGATRPIAASDICGGKSEIKNSEIPSAIQQKVFEEYGLANARTSDYELDYLITPELGGTTDVRNLWPEPFNRTEWNAHVKDALESLLYRKVCSGEIDLPTAQHEIATGWISAYKKYFHTDQPFATPSGLIPGSGSDPMDERHGEAILSVRLFGTTENR